VSLLSRGPWKARKDTDVRGNHCWIIDGPDVAGIAVLSYYNEQERDAGEADALAIAAVPDLIAALELLLKRASAQSSGTDFGKWHACGAITIGEVLSEARAALDKAKVKP
jgi:hypothetical protein